MTRDSLLLYSLLLLLACAVHCSIGADDDYSPQTGVHSNKKSWICALGRTEVNESGGWVNKTLHGAGCKSTNQIVGFVGAVVAIIFFGSNFIPVKKFDTGDGMFFQWIMCIGIWLVGLFVNFGSQNPPYYYQSIIGAFLWTSGNLMAVPIIKLIGLTMGLTVWGIVNLLSGWLQGLVLFDQKPMCMGFNYGGLGSILIGTLVFSFVTSEGKSKVSLVENGSREESPLLKSSPRTLPEQLNESSARVTFAGTRHKGTRHREINSDTTGKEQSDSSWTDKLGFWPRKLLGFLLSVASGLMYSTLFTFVQLMQLCEDPVHRYNRPLDYTFGLFSGILLASTFYFVIYSIYMRNKPRVYPSVILPGLISGAMWGIATSGWIVANSDLSLTVSFPLVASGPGALSSLYGILWFKEIKGWRNILTYIGGLVFLFPGVVLVGLSKCTKC